MPEGVVGSPIQLIVVPAEAAFETSPTVVEVPLLACPDNANYQIELLAVSVMFHTLPADGSNVLTGDLEWVDDSDSDTVADLKAGFDFLSGLTARVNNEIWRGKQILDPGDTVNMEMASTTPDTAGQGAAFIVEFRIRQGGQG